MGGSGGVPSLSGSGGFFPTGPQLNPGALPVFDLMGWANSGGTQVKPQGFDPNSLLSGIFGAPMQQQAPPPPRQQQAAPLSPNYYAMTNRGLGTPSRQYFMRGGR
jgi:hypothetical protein